MDMKTRLKISCSVFTILIFLYITFTPVSAGVVWSDDFEDGNLDGWTSGFDVFSVVDGVLRCEPPEGYMYPIGHSSSVASGTWSFDIYHKNMDTQEVTFIDSDAEDGTYFLRLSGTSIYLGSEIGGFADAIDNHDQEVAGWQSIDVTRSASGEFNVWVNGTHIMQGVDTGLSLCDRLVVGMRNGGCFDNVTVSNTVDIVSPTTTSTTSETTATITIDGATDPNGIRMELLIVGISVPIVLVVIVIIWKLKR
ncbi:MAG: hypothetical protein ACFFD6_05480 [Candidatus Thorarchaeota archaeon]